MERSLQLTWNHIAPSEAVADNVRQHVARLERFHGRITGCAVALESRSRHHHQSGSKFRVRIELTVPGGKLVVGRDPDQNVAHGDLYSALSAAFDEAKRQLHEYNERRLDHRRTHARPPTATVARLFPHDGYGFLETSDGREIYFHERSVLNGGFARLTVGTRVRFAEELGEKGPQASTVVALRRARRAAEESAEHGS